MRIHSSRIEHLPSTLGDELAQEPAAWRPAVLLGYDGTPSPIVDRRANRVGRWTNGDGAK